MPHFFDKEVPYLWQRSVFSTAKIWDFFKSPFFTKLTPLMDFESRNKILPTLTPSSGSKAGSFSKSELAIVCAMTRLCRCFTRLSPSRFSTPPRGAPPAGGLSSAHRWGRARQNRQSRERKSVPRDSSRRSTLSS